MSSLSECFWDDLRLMETGHQILSQEKRQLKSKDCTIQFVKLDDTFSYYNVLNEENKIKYIGRIEKTKSCDEYCSCPDQFHRSSKSYQDEHGFSLQCKHMIQAKAKRGWN